MTNLPSQAAVSGISIDDRMQWMQMYKEGEITLEELEDRIEAATSKSKTKKKGINRNQKALRNHRGRLEMCLTLAGKDKTSGKATLALEIKCCRDMLPMNAKGTADPLIKMTFDPPLKSKGKTLKDQKTNKRPNTRNPIFNETFTWDVNLPVDFRLYRIVLTAMSKKDAFMGRMAFLLSNVAAPNETSGPTWYRWLGEERGMVSNLPDMKRRPLPPVTPAGGPPSAIKHAPSQHAARRPLPPAPTGQAALPHGPSSGGDTRSSAGSVSPTSPSSHSTPHIPPAAAQAPQAQPATRMVERLPSSPGISGVSCDDFTFLKVLGQGSFGKVFLAEFKANKEIVAVKFLRKQEVIDEGDFDCTMVERRVLELGNECPFLTKLRASFQTADKLCYVMEFISGGDLMYHIQQLEGETGFPEKRCQLYIAEICVGLWFLHDKGVVYRDLKLDNVMIDNKGHVKIADFGMCKEGLSATGKTNTFCGTPGYLAPEVVKKLAYGYSVDFWALGVLAHEILLQESPFEADDHDELFTLILEAKLDIDDAPVSSAAKAVIKEFLQTDPSKRLGCGPDGRRNIKKHKFFAGLDWDKVANCEYTPDFVPGDVDGEDNIKFFDETITEQDATLTPPDEDAIHEHFQEKFNGFSYVEKRFGKPESKSFGFGGDGASGGAKKSSSPQPKAWLQPKYTRAMANEAMNSKTPGSFVIRTSKTSPGAYALHLATGAPRSWTGLIEYLAETKSYRLASTTDTFPSLDELVDHFSLMPVPGAQTVNGAPITLRL